MLGEALRPFWSKQHLLNSLSLMQGPPKCKAHEGLSLCLVFLLLLFVFETPITEE